MLLLVETELNILQSVQEAAVEEVHILMGRVVMLACMVLEAVAALETIFQDILQVLALKASL